MCPAGADQFVIINQNFINSSRIRIGHRQGVGSVNQKAIALPKPLDMIYPIQGILQTNMESSFTYTLYTSGALKLTGEFVTPNELLIVTIPPYLAKLPLEFMSI